MERRKSICGRSLDHGPGSCHFWWDSCPEKVRHCFYRFARENGGEIDLAKAQEWAGERDKALQPQCSLDLGAAA